MKEGENLAACNWAISSLLFSSRNYACLWVWCLFIRHFLWGDEQNKGIAPHSDRSHTGNEDCISQVHKDNLYLQLNTLTLHVHITNVKGFINLSEFHRWMNWVNKDLGLYFQLFFSNMSNIFKGKTKNLRKFTLMFIDMKMETLGLQRIFCLNSAVQ